jgi:hypothetical protein
MYFSMSSRKLMSYICTPGVPKYQALRQSFEDLRLALTRYEESGLPIDEQACKNLLTTTTEQLTDYENWLLTPIKYQDEQLVTSDALVLEAIDRSLLSLGKSVLDLKGLYNAVIDQYVCSLDLYNKLLPKDFDFSLLKFLSKLQSIRLSGIPHLESLPRLPPSITEIYSRNSGLRNISEPLSGNVVFWDCSFNAELQFLPELNEGLRTLESAHCGLTQPPTRLPISLRILLISSNPYMKALPKLSPDMELRELHADNVGLVNLPDDFLETIPSKLKYLDLRNNHLNDESKSKLRQLRARNIEVFFDE